MCTVHWSLNKSYVYANPERLNDGKGNVRRIMTGIQICNLSCPDVTLAWVSWTVISTPWAATMVTTGRTPWSGTAPPPTSGPWWCRCTCSAPTPAPLPWMVCNAHWGQTRFGHWQGTAARKYWRRKFVNITTENTVGYGPKDRFKETLGYVRYDKCRKISRFSV